MKNSLISLIQILVMAICIALGASCAKGFQQTWVEWVKGAGAIVTSDDIIGSYLFTIIAGALFGGLVCMFIQGEKDN